MKTIIRIITMILLLAVVMPFIQACSNTNDEISQSEASIPSDAISLRETLVVGYTDFSFQFNPFYASTSNDLDVINMTSVHLLAFDRSGALVEHAADGKTVEFNGAEYKYEGISNVDISIDDSGEVIYDFTLREGVKFSDGELLNADDVIFTMYVLADPSYDGPATFSSLPIKGIGNYIGGITDNISGIIKTGEYSFKIVMTHYDSAAAEKMDFFIAPMHYYGNAELYIYEQNSFGFKKGDLSSVKENLNSPVGAGAYVFQNYSNGVIKFVRNENYYKGTPKIKFVEFRETDEKKMLSSIVNGDIDIGTPAYTSDTVEDIEKVNGGTLSGAVLSVMVSENSGYGYIGISADNVKVGDDKASAESKSLRKAFATIFSAYREAAVNEYYGDMAYVIEYPVSSVSWAYPTPADDGYKTAYSVDLFGNSIYTDSMTDSEKIAAALSAAIEYFKAAGFIYDEKIGAFISAPEGASLSYEVTVPACGIGDHPSYNVFANAKNVLNSMGITLKINDVADVDSFWKAIDNGESQFWAAAWDSASDPDLYQVYHSSNIIGLNGSTNSNYYGITDETLDALILSARASTDKEFRKSVYRDCFDVIFDWGVEIPLYQRMDAIVVNSHAVNTSSLSHDYTAHWNWLNDIHNYEINP